MISVSAEMRELKFVAVIGGESRRLHYDLFVDSIRHQESSRRIHLHDNRRSINIDLDALMRQNASAIDVNLVADGDIVSKNGDIL